MGFLGVSVDDSWLFLEESAKMWGNLRAHSWEMNNTDPKIEESFFDGG